MQCAVILTVQLFTPCVRAVVKPTFVETKIRTNQDQVMTESKEV